MHPPATMHARMHPLQEWLELHASALELHEQLLVAGGNNSKAGYSSGQTGWQWLQGIVGCAIYPLVRT